jgi:FkbM family methyltransferase
MLFIYKFKQKIKNWKWAFLKSFSLNTVVQTDLFKIKVSSRDEGIGRQYFLYGQYGLVEIDKAIGVLKKSGIYKNGTLLDIGANIGHVALHCLSKNYSNAAVCIEPDEFNFGLLGDNIKLNNYAKNASLFKVALGSKNGKEKIILSEDNYGDHRIYTENEEKEIDKYNLSGDRKVGEIEITTLDELAKNNDAFKNVTFISIDVQGFELEILKGGPSFFKLGMPMMLEIDPYLLEKKGSNLIVLTNILSGCYSNFVDLHSEKLAIQNMSEFNDFYNGLNSGKKDYSDLLFFNLKPNNN